VVQRVSRASVTVESRLVGEIGMGVLVLLGVGRGDVEADADYLATGGELRIFPDPAGQ
jgi:D-tyrosyl-tRNA(Tyr) deacylase